MIFVTVGTQKWPFDRLLEIIDSAIERKDISPEVFGQIGCAIHKPRFFPCEKMLLFDRFVEEIKRSEIVISHAGAGTMILCLRMGKIPILFPRDAARGEVLDNHQMDLMKKMEETGKILAAYSGDDLIYKVIHYEELICNLKPTKTLEGRDKLAEYLGSLH